MVKRVILLLLTTSLLAACGHNGKNGNPGHRGYVVYPVGQGYKLLTRCEYQWTAENFQYKTFFSVREKEDRTARFTFLCNAKSGGTCKDKDFIVTQIPLSSRAFSAPVGNDGLVTAEMIGKWQSKFVNLYAAEKDVQCDGSGSNPNKP